MTLVHEASGKLKWTFSTYMGTLEKKINFGTVRSEYLSYEYAVKDFGLYI